jgi:cytochrome c oxidase cbb3-type subunit 2
MRMLSLHQKIERNSALLIFGILVVASLGGLVQIVPSLFQDSLSTPSDGVRPYSAAELIGRDVYIREGCSTCHSQQVRPLLAEVRRYGAFSRAGEFVYDRPFLWGSKRTGPDLHRLGGKYSDAWHRLHLLDPRAVVPASIMPAYPWLEERIANEDGSIEQRLRALQALGHPYSDDEIAAAPEALDGVTELDALVAYLQSLGTAVTETRP